MVNELRDALAHSFGETKLGRMLSKKSVDPMAMLTNINPLGMMTPPPRGGAALLESYSQCPPLRMVVGRVAADVSNLPWQIFVGTKKDPSGVPKAYQNKMLQQASAPARRALRKDWKRRGLDTTNLREIEAHPMLDCLAAGNRRYKGIGTLGGISTFEVFGVHIDLVGEGFLIKERDGLRVPSNLWCIPPQWIWQLPCPQDPFYHLRFQQVNLKIDPEDVIYAQHPNPTNPYRRGSGIGMALGNEVDTDHYISEHIKAAFYNNLRPDLIIAGAQLNPADTVRIEADWRNRFRQIYNRFMPYFLAADIKVHDLNKNFDQMQVAEQRKLIRDAIREIYGAPPEIFGILESSNRATSEAAEYLYHKGVVDPRKDFVRQTLQDQLVPDYDVKLILDYPSPVEADREYIQKVAVAAPWALRVDEWRELMEFEALPGGQGQVHVMSAGLLIRKDLTPDDLSIPAPVDPAKPKDPAADPPKEDPAADPADDTTTEDPKKARARIKGALKTHDLQAVVDAIQDDPMQKEFRTVQEALVQSFGQRMLDQIGAGYDFNMHNPKVVSFLHDESAKRITGIDDTTRDAVRDVLEQGSENNLTINELATAIEGVFDEASGWRAVTIARTETGVAANFASYTAMEDANVERKEWVATVDDQTREDHLQLDGEVLDMDEDFAAPSDPSLTAPYPQAFGDPSEDINCRCIIVAAVSTKALSTPEQRAALWRSHDRERGGFERQLRAGVRRAMGKQRDAAISKLRQIGEQSNELA